MEGDMQQDLAPYKPSYNMSNGLLPGGKHVALGSKLNKT